MFFKKMTKREQVNAHKAAGSAFVFYLLALGVHAMYALQTSRHFCDFNDGSPCVFHRRLVIQQKIFIKKEALITRASFLFQAFILPF